VCLPSLAESFRDLKISTLKKCSLKKNPISVRVLVFLAVLYSEYLWKYVHVKPCQLFVIISYFKDVQVVVGHFKILFLLPARNDWEIPRQTSLRLAGLEVNFWAPNIRNSYHHTLTIGLDVVKILWLFYEKFPNYSISNKDKKNFMLLR